MKKNHMINIAHNTLLLNLGNSIQIWMDQPSQKIKYWQEILESH